jgi:hypothetical protein
MNLGDFKSQWPNGASALAVALRTGMEKTDSIGKPIEKWTAEDFDEARKSVRDLFMRLRRHADAGNLKPKAVDRFGKIPEGLHDRAKAIRKHLRLIEPEAVRLFATLRSRLENPKTREPMLFYLRTWKQAASNVNISPTVAAKMLLGLLSTDHLEVPSDGVTMGLLQAIERGDFDTESHHWPTTQGIAASTAEHWTYELVPVDEANAREQLLPAPDLGEKVRQAMAAYARQLGDRDGDLMTYLMARYAERARHPEDKVTIALDDVMQALGYTRHRSGHGGESFKAEDKAVVREQIERLENGYLTVRKAGSLVGSSRKVDIEGRVFIIEYRIGQADLEGRVRDWSSISVRFGGVWSVRLFDERGRMTALLQANALSYDASKERLEKRILKRLGWFWKLNSGRLDDQPFTAPRTVEVWVRDDVGDDYRTYTRRDAERLEKAFDRLKADGNIGDWRYVGGEQRISDMPGSLQRGWLERWVEREIMVEAPESLRLAYMGRKAKRLTAPAAAATPAIANDDYGQQVRRFRMSHNISALELSKEIGVHPSVLSRIETGKRAASMEQRKKIDGWMRELKNRPDLQAARHG